MALAASHAAYGTPLTLRALEWFVGFSMAVLALLKLQNVESFAIMFLNYDLLAKRWVRYSYIYPFAEGLAGVLMIADVADLVPRADRTVYRDRGAASVCKAVYLNRRELKCACVGRVSNVALGFRLLTENLMMIAMAAWMGLAALGLAYGTAHEVPEPHPVSGPVFMTKLALISKYCRVILPALFVTPLLT